MKQKTIAKLKEYFNDVSHQKFNEKGQYVFTDGTNINELRHVILENVDMEYCINICGKEYKVYEESKGIFVMHEKTSDREHIYTNNMYKICEYLFSIYSNTNVINGVR